MIRDKKVLLCSMIAEALLMTALLTVSGKNCSAKTETAIAEEVIQTTADVLQSEEPADPVLPEETTASPEPAASVSPTDIPAPTQTPPAGRLVKKKYKTYFILEDGTKYKKNFVTIGNKTYYFDKHGEMFYGWLKKDKQYYYLNRATGRLKKRGKVDGVRIRGGCAVKTKFSRKKIETMMTAAKIVKEITKPSDSKAQKRLKCYKYIMKFGYCRYRMLKPIYKKKGWEITFANDIFKRKGGCCVAESSALAFLFHECGYRNVYVCHDTEHAWVELNGRVYDNLFSEARDFWKYYGCSYEGYACHPVQRIKI